MTDILFEIYITIVKQTLLVRYLLHTSTKGAKRSLPSNIPLIFRSSWTVKNHPHQLSIVSSLHFSLDFDFIPSFNYHMCSSAITTTSLMEFHEILLETAENKKFLNALLHLYGNGVPNYRYLYRTCFMDYFVISSRRKKCK